MVQSISDYLRTPAGGSTPIEDWAFTPILAAMIAGAVVNGTAPAAAGRYTLTPAVTLSEVVGGSGVYGTTAPGNGIVNAAGAEFMDYIVPTYDAGDTVAFIGCGILQNGNAFSDVFNQLSGAGVAGDFSYFLQQTAATGSLSLVYCEDGVTDQVSGLGSVAAGDRVQFGYNKNTGEISLKINTDPTQVIHTLPSAGQAEDYVPFATLMSTAANPVFTAGGMDFTFDTTSNGLQGMRSLSAPSLPSGAKDGSRFRITTPGGGLFGKTVQQDDVVELYNNTSSIVVYRAGTPANLADVQAEVGPVDARLAAAELTLSALGRTDDGVIAVEGYSQDGNLTSSADGKIYMVDPTINPSGDLAGEGYVGGELFRYNHSGATAAEKYQQLTLDIGQKITIFTFDNALGGSINAPFIWSGGIQEIIDAALAKNVNINWAPGGNGGLIGAGWIPAPEIFELSVAGGGLSIPSVTLTAAAGELDPTKLRQSVFADADDDDVDGRVTLTMGAGQANGQFGYLYLTVAGTGVSASAVEFVLPNDNRITLGGSAGGGSRSTAVLKWYIDTEGRLSFKTETIWEANDSMSRGHISFPVAPTTYKVWEGRSFFALNNVDATTFTLQLPITPGYPAGGDDAREGTLEVMILNDVTTFAVDIAHITGKSLIGKPIPTSITANDVLRFKYVDEYIVFLGVL